MIYHTILELFTGPAINDSRGNRERLPSSWQPRSSTNRAGSVTRSGPVHLISVYASAAGRTTAALGRVLAVDPRAGQLLVRLGRDRAARVVALPAHDLARLAVLLAAGLPAFRPTGVGLDRLALLLVPEQRLALAVALHAHRHRRERRRPQVRRAHRLAGPAADALEEVGP